MNKNKLVDIENKLIFAKWEGVRRTGEKGGGIKTCKLPVIKTVRGMLSTAEGK